MTSLKTSIRNCFSNQSSNYKSPPGNSERGYFISNGIKLGEIDGELCLRLDREHKEYQHLFTPFHAWQQMAAKLESGEISQEEYDNWRYKYPELDTSEIRAKVPSQGLSDDLIKALKKENQ